MSNAQDDTEQQVCLQCRKNAPLLGVHVKNEMRRKHEIAIHNHNRDFQRNF